MDHPEPISKRSVDIPQCRKGFTLDQARTFLDQVMEMLRGLENMTDLRSMYETEKQLSRVYFDCHSYRTELAQHLISCDYPAFASKMMKKLNNMSVFKNDDIWFSSFYFYNTTWNFSDTWPEFASALAAAGLPNLLNLNIGHQPYLQNLDSKNVYYLIKASLSIIHNIARVPGNSHYFAAESVRQALVHLAQREEDFLRCVSTLCLAHIVSESELPQVTDPASGGVDLLRVLVGYVGAARSSEKRRCHGFQVIELLDALCTLSVHDSVKSEICTFALGGSIPNSGTISTPSATADQTCLGLLKDLVEIALLATPSAVALREAEKAIRILWNVAFDTATSVGISTHSQLKTWFSDVLANPATCTQLSKAMVRAMEATQWRLLHPGSAVLHPEPNECGPIFFSFAPSNRPLVSRIVDRLREANLSLSNLPFATEPYLLSDASAVGMSMCGTNAGSLQQWLDCVDQASLIVVCLSDSYRLSPGCRFELERFLSRGSGDQSKLVAVVSLQPKLKPTGWLARMVTKAAIEFNGKRDMDTCCDVLVKQLQEMMVDVKMRVEAALLAASRSARRHPSMDTKSHAALAGDTGLTSASRTEPSMNHLNAHAVGGSRAPSGLSTRRDDEFTSPGQYTASTKRYYRFCDLSPGSLPNIRLIPTGAWRHMVRPEVRKWSTHTVASWLKFRSLGHVPEQVPGGIDGILLSQLAGLRLWAPEYFTHSLHAELGLSFSESLRFLEALDELAPEDDETKKVYGEDEAVDDRSPINALDRTPSRT